MKVLARSVPPGQVPLDMPVQNTEREEHIADPAAVFAAAVSLWRACQKAAQKEPMLGLGKAYRGFDQLMREVMRVAQLFEDWACRRVAFSHTTEVWPYFLEEKFGESCLLVMKPDALAEFGAEDCLQVALRLALPIMNED